MIISKLEWIGLVHGRGFARNEVGLAIINLTACELHLCQMTDSHGFVKTLTKMNLFRPTEVNKTNNIAGEMSPFSSLSLTHTHTHKTRRQWGQNLTPLFTSFFSISSVSSLFIYFFITIDFLFFFSFFFFFLFFDWTRHTHDPSRSTHRPKGPIVPIPIDPSSLWFIE